ncbi:TetR/AcrR family transcriptional regulator [Demequina sp. SYSU T00039]|uniref:TetR/AcrR family transcriptional regulator n=1 Tax=Demequina lignilytica TaxID=3051663 RepID=A0AAW7M7E2_9MICO|nr:MULTISPECIES: TetR/AcrR family transcriptional regulator [unclassified Demequina]MDN4478901.1 TetR/AcrR family transcriptional regulator [Demequina sp. SYSU T00039-1]MDN4488776.1 TetR/AcrR family transcriptional regulator [Demequina sp. SYSU T00039]MDN4491840.1 TetR/AcrR family transcriptional regulator [Demequina sp. SYSU T00068]
MDARIVRTRRSLQEALFALARERGVDEISVSDIAARAGVNRSTFYQHYSDKETLLADALDLIADEAGAQLGEIDFASPDPPQALLGFLAHIEAHAALYARVFSEPGYGAVLARLRANARDAIRGLAPEAEPIMPRQVPVDVVAAGITGLVLGVIGEWLAQEDRPGADEAGRWIWRIVLGLPGLSPER